MKVIPVLALLLLAAPTAHAYVQVGDMISLDKVVVCKYKETLYEAMAQLRTDGVLGARSVFRAAIQMGTCSVGKGLTEIVEVHERFSDIAIVLVESDNGQRMFTITGEAP